MHRLVLGLERTDSRQVDHINHEGLDNRRSNLRIVTSVENKHNVRPFGNTEYVGVHYVRDKQRFIATMGRKHLGYFDTAEEAAVTRDAATRERYGDVCFLNFPGYEGESPPKRTRRRFNPEQVREIRRLIANNEATMRNLGAEYGVDPQTIRYIVLRKSYKDID